MNSVLKNEKTIIKYIRQLKLSINFKLISYLKNLNFWTFLKQAHKLIIKSSFHIYILTRLDYSISIFWLDSITQYQSSDSTWYQSWIRVWFEFLTWLIKQSKMISNVKIYYFWIYYVIIFERLSCNKWIYFSSRCLHYLVALSIKYIV